MEALAPDEAHKLARRLAWDGIGVDALQQWLTRQEADAGDASGLEATPAQIDLQACQAALKKAWDAPLLPYASGGHLPFIDLWWPIRELARQRLEAEREQISGGDGVAVVVAAQLADSLLERLCAIGEEVLWQGFHEGRSPGTMLLAHLGAAGDGSGPPLREHYESFIRSHRRDGLTALLQEFPVLGRLIGTVFSLWLEGSIEILQRICADRPLLAERFSVPAGHWLSHVKQGLSDPHRGGRAVSILQFSAPEEDSASGNEVVSVVYKPKDMGVDAAYQAALSDLNVHGGLPPLHTLAVHNADGYGYMEYVPHRLCTSDDELNLFYENAGRLTAILHLLGCTDCHHENLIACGDQLLLIDTETLLEADLPDHIAAAASDTAQPGPSQLQRRFQQSVLRSGLLPQWMFIGAAKVAIDSSALGIAPPLEAERPQTGWLGLNSDGMMPGRVKRPAALPTSLPVGVGATNPMSRHMEVFCEGFARQCQALIAIRERWLAADGVLLRFAGLPRRIVLRATRVYFAIQRQQLEPAALRSSFAQAMKLEQLARSFLLAETRPLHWPVFAAEVRQMQQLDIPFFTHPIDGDALQLGEDTDDLSGFIKTSGLAAARERLQSLDADEIAFQLRLIDGTAKARQLRVEAVAGASGSVANSETEAEAIDAGQAARRIAERLLAMAIADPQGQVEWLGMDVGADGQSFSFGPVGSSLYGGSIGIACLLKCLQDLQVELMPAPVAGGSALTPQVVFEAILHPLRLLVAESAADGRLRWWRDQPLGLSGCGGLLLALQQIGETALAKQLLAVALPRVINADQQLDVIGGCAGLIGALLQLGGEQALQLAMAAGDHLLAQQNDQGAWSPSSRQLALLGFSHGTAGYAAALARLHAACGEERFRSGSAAALAYERSHFDQARGNWPDYRSCPNGTEPPEFTVSWCHGAPGIALGRACLWGTALWDDQCAEEISAALGTTAALSGHGLDHLCCGSLGLMAVLELLSAGPWPLPQSLRESCLDVADMHRREALKRCTGAEIRMRCFGTGEGTLMLPGFYTGLSGMGLALLGESGSKGMLGQLLSAGYGPIGVMH
ncbi:type 2 lanthipeptide synthetase LanM family protein [Synechococcus sp. CCY9201]|nr:type 2 lanthipeptide synthetase LanM family protein [Synechococcus sp. CCY9201]